MTDPDPETLWARIEWQGGAVLATYYRYDPAMPDTPGRRVAECYYPYLRAEQQARPPFTAVILEEEL